MWGILVSSALTVGAAAQEESAAPPSAELVVMAADEQNLWLASVEPARSVVFHRGVNAPFRACPPLSARIACLASAGGRLHVSLDDGRFYTFSDRRWTRGRDLPDRVVPLDMVSTGAAVYALIRSPATGDLPQLVGGERSATSRPFDAGGATLTVARRDSLGWAALAACPMEPGADVPPARRPRLALIRDDLYVFWCAGGTDDVVAARWEVDPGRWSAPLTVASVAGLDGFWTTEVSGVSALAFTIRAEAGASVSLLRLLGRDPADDEAWRPAPLVLSDLPSAAEPTRYEAVAGFNQHLAMIAADGADRRYLRFGRINIVPAEATVDVGEVFAGRAGRSLGLRWMHWVTMAAVFAVLVLLFTFRRRAMVTDVKLPEGAALALSLQRLVGFAIDLTPFAIVVALFMGVDYQEGLRELFGWAAGRDAAEGHLPASDTMLWWGASVVMYTTYSLLMELMTRRTVGKLLVGTRLISESGTHASAGQVVLRNLMRLFELLPPLWILGFLVVLSRNNQRVGDIFARTVVIRRAATPEQPRSDDEDKRPPDDGA